MRAPTTVYRRAATTHAISNPTLANIEKRWEGMPLPEQAELWMALRDRMKGPWQELTLQEKKAGALGPSKHADPQEIAPCGHNCPTGRVSGHGHAVAVCEARQFLWLP